MIMKILKRSGKLEPFDVGKLRDKIEATKDEFDLRAVDGERLAELSANGAYQGQPSSDLNDMIARTAANLIEEHLNYDKLAVAITTQDLRKDVGSIFYVAMEKLYLDGQVSETFWKDVQILEEKFYISSQIVMRRNYSLTYFSLCTLKRMFLMKIDGKFAECPQFMFMRVAIHLNGSSDYDSVIQTYEMLSRLYYTHGTPTLCNSGKIESQLASCYLMTLTSSDDTKEIMNLLQKCVLVCEKTGGVGLCLSRLSKMKFVSTVKLIDTALNFVNSTNVNNNQRVGGIAVYVEPWHAGILDFLQFKERSGKEEMRARSLFYGLWIPDLFMKRVYEDKNWTLFDPAKIDADKLVKTHGKKFDSLYEEFEKDESVVYSVKKARDIFNIIMKVQMEVGGPYLLFKDACNRFNMQDYLGTLETSNLCTEILEYCSHDYAAICNLASISLPKFVKKRAFTYRKKGSRTVETVARLFAAKVEIDDLSKIDKSRELSPSRVNDVMTKYLIDTRLTSFSEPPSSNQSSSPSSSPTLPTAGIRTDDKPQNYVEGKVEEEVEEEKEELTEQNAGKCENDPNAYIVADGDKLWELYFDFDELANVTQLVTKNLNNVIDKQYDKYSNLMRSNLDNRPIGIGVQGLADVFAMLNLPFESEKARILNLQIFETIYYSAAKTSCELARINEPFANFERSKYKKGILHFDQFRNIENFQYSFKNGRIPTQKWEALREDIKVNGIRNSLLTAVMPTATTSQLLGNNESIEPYTSNFYVRRTQAGEYKIINQHLIRKLESESRWNKNIRLQITESKGSVNNLSPDIMDDETKKIFKTNWEIPQKALIQLAIDRAPFIDQSQSLNIHIEKPTVLQMYNLHHFTWKSNLKTGMYYLRTNPIVKSADFNNPSYKICESCAA